MKIKYELPEEYTVSIEEIHYKTISVKAYTKEEAIEIAKRKEREDDGYVDHFFLEYNDTVGGWFADKCPTSRGPQVIDIGVQCAKRVADVYSKKGPAFMHKNYLTDVEENVIPMLEANLSNVTEEEVTTAKRAASWTAQAHLKSR